MVINSAGDLVLADVDNDIRMPIGAPLTPGERARVSTAVWSASGQWTAWAVDSVDIDGTRQLRLHNEDTDQAGVLLESVSAFYLCPSPGGRWLSHLSLGPLGLELAVSDVASGSIHIVERGQPLFWSWSPDASQIAVHVENRVVVSDPHGASNRVLTVDAGPFVTPWWLPGGAVIYAVDDRIVVSGPDDSVTTLVAGGSTGRFALDPDGRRLAFIASTEQSASLTILDLVSLTTIHVSSEPIVAFFWSPDGSRLASLVTPSDGQLQWMVGDGSQTWRSAPFRPTRAWVGSVLPFFEQYAQSHNVWTSDGTKLVAPAVDGDGHCGAIVYRVDANTVDSNGTQWIPDAELAWWA